ncbi:hypothetical protein AQUCO_07800044v1 [Aquilegia coerulea]|uniref:Uncharacterized protein n=1 Tax=Aquilegia coerulea TaxID=218851 RepID=A0A2G5C9B1_AQUCA|nr:hypothetical protein AQUCO_07800044v1 [Aquilegia coerulea]
MEEKKRRECCATYPDVHLKLKLGQAGVNLRKGALLAFFMNFTIDRIIVHLNIYLNAPKVPDTSRCAAKHKSPHNASAKVLCLPSPHPFLRYCNKFFQVKVVHLQSCIPYIQYKS